MAEFFKESNGVLFVWRGGPYIDTYMQHQMYVEQEESEYAGWYITNVNINVWDYADDKSSIPLTQQAFEKKVDTWVRDVRRMTTE